MQRQLSFLLESSVSPGDFPRQPMEISSQSTLVEMALALGARRVPLWSPAEQRLAQLGSAPSLPAADVATEIRQGGDPLGDAFCRLRSAADRRKLGATYTPTEVVEAMLDGIARKGQPDRVVDPGVGSARFLVEAGRRFPDAQLVGIEIDPVAALIARANLAAMGLAERASVITGDYRDVRLPAIAGRTAYIGNPPYVRHHQIPSKWKHWLSREAGKRDLHCSQLAGLHVHFLLATAIAARAGDFGSLVTAAEWLDVNYGQLVRDLFLGELGGESIILIDPKAEPFPGTATTAAIIHFEVQKRPSSIRMRRVDCLSSLATSEGGRRVQRDRLRTEKRWTHLTGQTRRTPQGYVELGELFRVHRGQVTGANRIWISGPHSRELPGSVLFPSITRARELFEAGLEVSHASHLRKVIDLPVDLSVFTGDERARVDRFLRQAKLAGAPESYVARNRRAWWSVGLRPPAPILATYMARRPPAFVLNKAAVRHLNIAHGLYPREPMEEDLLVAVVKYLAGNGDLRGGRTYAGGLTKFEPREMERIRVPGPDILLDSAA